VCAPQLDVAMFDPESATPIRCLPRRFAAKNGLLCKLRLLPDGGGSSAEELIAMYLGFRPRNCFHGLPPIKDPACVQWVQDMLRMGINVVADSESCGLVGHAALFPIHQRKCEMLAVVCPGFQNIGIGTELVRSSIELAGELGYEQIWLEVEASNGRARHVYRKCGFEYASDRQGREMDMTYDVLRCRERSSVPDMDRPARQFPVPRFHFPALVHGSPAGPVGR